MLAGSQRSFEARLERAEPLLDTVFVVCLCMCAHDFVFDLFMSHWR